MENLNYLIFFRILFTMACISITCALFACKGAISYDTGDNLQNQMLTYVDPSPPPTILNYIDIDRLNLRSLSSGVEKISPQLAVRLSKNMNFYYKYGPTEAAVFCTCWKADSKKRSVIPIGKSIYNMKILILDQYKNIVPIGTTGEIYVGGVGAENGYLGNEQKTKASFIKNPLDRFETIYKTGDIGKWDEDGNLIYVGRNDSQLKIRGYRIEKGEIENAVLRLNEINSCYIDVIGHEENKELVCYYSTTHGEMIDQSRMSDLKSNEIPRYMIPSFFQFVETMPKNINGKIDGFVKSPISALRFIPRHCGVR